MERIEKKMGNNWKKSVKNRKKEERIKKWKELEKSGKI